MTATANQKSLVRNKIRCGATRRSASHSIMDDVTVLTIYDIQGREFQAVFLSTSEPTDKLGQTKNPTKSPCNQYVFNTALTRSKSLVVCFGNPFLLLKTEEQVGNECQCWKDYLRRCIESKTFHVPESLKLPQEQRLACIQKLQQLVFLNESTEAISNVPLHTDTIIATYRKAFEKHRRCKDCILDLREEAGTVTWTVVEKDPNGDLEEHDSSGFNVPTSMQEPVKCELVVKTLRKAIAHPLDRTKHQGEIIISGSSNRRGAFDGDTVDVEILFVSKEGVEEKYYGRVVKVEQKCRQLKYVCKVDKKNAVIFIPIDRKTPRFVNLPKFLRNFSRNYDREMIESGFQSQKDSIVVFDEHTFTTGEGDISLPLIKEVISVTKADDLLFVVMMMGWNPKFSHPLGAVIQALPRGTSFFYAERLLKVSCDITSTEINSEPSAIPQIQRDSSLKFYDRAFTIDPPEAVNLDDAVSLIPDLSAQDSYELLIFITNVAKHIRKSSPMDDQVKRRGISVYGSKQDKIPMQMIPSKMSTELSLLPGRVRDAICISTSVCVAPNGDVHVSPPLQPKEVQVQSCLQLTYANAQAIMSDIHLDSDLRRKVVKFDSQEGNLPLSKVLQLLYKIAMHLRQNRIGKAAYCYEISEPGEENNWQAHLLIEELMIWANSSVATFVHENLPSQTLVRRQPSPGDIDFAAFCGQHSNVFGHCLAFQHYNAKHARPLVPLVVTIPMLNELNKAILSKNTHKLQFLLTNVSGYPQLATAKAHHSHISRRAEYVCTLDEPANNCSTLGKNSMHLNGPYWHNTLKLDLYTHFTSPLRRYCDIAVQRLILGILDSSVPQYTTKDIDEMCRHLNVRSRAAQEFENSMKKVELAIECGKSCKKAMAFVVREREKSKVEMFFPDMQIQSRDFTFHISSLTCTPTVCSVGDHQQDFLLWKSIIVSFDRDHHGFLLTNSRICDVREVSDLPNRPQPGQATMKIFYETVSESDVKDEQIYKVGNYLASILSEVVEITPQDWKKATSFVQSDKKSVQGLQGMFPSQRQGGTTDKSILDKFNQSPILYYCVSRTLDSSDVMNLWVGKSIQEPILIPSLQLIEVAPEMKICLQHNRNAPYCFSDVNLHQASKARYNSTKEYVSLWEKALLAEAATVSVKSQSLIFIKGVRLEWVRLAIPDTCFDDLYYVPEEVRMSIPLEYLNQMEYIKARTGDLVCARYEIQPQDPQQAPTLRAVFHFVISKAPNRLELEEIKEKLKEAKEEGKEDHNLSIPDVIMKHFGKNSCCVSEDMYRRLNSGNPPRCEVQLVLMEDSYSRVYNRLLCFSDDNPFKKELPSELSAKIACGTLKRQEVVKDTMSILDDPLACTIWGSKPRKELNTYQKDALLLGCKQKFQLIQGPPGTGKSEVGAHLVYIFAIKNGDDKSVLYCGPSNKAVDVVHEKLAMVRIRSKPLNIIRVYGRTHEHKDFSSAFLHTEMRSDKASEGRCLPNFRKDSLHHKIREKKTQIVEMERLFAEMAEKNQTPKSIMLNNYRDLIRQAERDVLSKPYHVILCTCNETCSTRMIHSARFLKIEQCIVDECGMAQEPETIAAISLSTHVVLIGDHKQLQPVINYGPARENGLSTSLFERYAEKTHIRPYRLRRQYRMHEAICKFPSEQFYEGELEADESLARRTPPGKNMGRFWPGGTKCPIVFCNVFGKEEDYKAHGNVERGRVDPHSKCNCQEVNKVMEIIKRLYKIHSVECNQIAVITPYRAQKELIQEAMDKEGFKKKNRPSVVTIMESQGDEYDYLIMTTVRSQPVQDIQNPRLVQPDNSWLKEQLGFLIDTHQINVGITRAKHGLIIVGNKLLLRYDNTWKALLEHYESKDCIVDCEDFPKY